MGIVRRVGTRDGHCPTHGLATTCPQSGPSNINLCLRCLLLHSCGHLFWRGRKKISDLCLHCYPFLSSFLKTKFQWIPAVLTLSSYEVKLSLTLHNSTGRPQSMHRYCSVWCNCSLLLPCKLSKGICTQSYKLTLTADTLHISLCLFSSFTLNVRPVPKSTKSTQLLSQMHHTCWIPASVFQRCPFQLWTETHLRASPSVFFSGKQEKGGESEDLCICNTRAGTC